MRDIDVHDRPREKMVLKGAVSLEDHELISAILGKGTPNRDIISISREVADLLQKEDLPGYDQLISVEGIGQSKACVLLACFEIARRYGKPSDEPTRKITRPDDILQLPEITETRYKKQEHFLVVTLNGASEVIQSRTITMGLLNHSLVHPREVYCDAISDRAASIICVHNHPSGNLEPSSQDIQITTQLVQAGKILGIPLLDHIIISKTGITSLKEGGYL
nr:DNA repair protein RadC [uncultured Methanospirillum sp.]